MSEDLFDEDLDFLQLTQMGYFDLVEDSADLFSNSFEEEVSNTNTAPAEATDNNQASKAPTFIDVSSEDKDNFLEMMKNKNTVQKTESSMRQFRRWLMQPPRNEKRNVWGIMPAELDNLIGSFLLSIRKADGSEYEPDTLTSYHRGIDRCLREKKYPYSIITDKEFETSRKVLSSKRKELKGKGKGNRPNAAEPLTVEEREKLREKGVTGMDSPKQLLNLVWLNNTVLFGLRGGNENRQLCWGDIEVKRNERGREYLEYNERITKTRTGETTTEIRAFKPKQFSHENKETCPVFAYRKFASHRPNDMSHSNSPFYLAINHKRQPDSQKWYKSQPLGLHSLNTLMKNMASDCNLKGKKTNHSARKTTCTDLLHSGVAPTTIQQLSAHRNVQSVNNYAKASLDMQENMSDILSNNPLVPRQTTSIPEKHPLCIERSLPCQVRPSIPSTSASMVKTSTNNMSGVEVFSKQSGQILQYAKLMNCPITIINNTGPSGNPSPVRATSHKRRRILPIVESESDSD